MRGLPSDALLTALYARLTGNQAAGVPWLTCPVYSAGAVPVNADRPYCVIEELTDVPWDTLGGEGYEVTVTLTVIVGSNPGASTRTAGLKPLAVLQDRATQSLSSADLTLAGGWRAIFSDIAGAGSHGEGLRTPGGEVIPVTVGEVRYTYYIEEV